MDGVGATEAAALPAHPSWVVRRRFGVAEYHRMAEAGILGEDDRVELVEGEVVEMSPVGGPHIGAVMALNHLLVAAAAGRARVSVQSPVRLGDRSEPQPDLAVLRPRADRYRGGEPPTAADVLLLVEVADSSLRYDRGVKLPLYARHGVPEVGVVDLAAGAVELHRGPLAGRYASAEREGPGAELEPLGLPGARIPVADMLSG